MTQQDIQLKHAEISLRLRIQKAAVTAIQGELKGLQEICLHPNGKRTTSYDYDGGSDSTFKCPDCGYSGY
jgi:hypothetical protein